MSPNVLAARLRHLQRRFDADLEALVREVSAPPRFTASAESPHTGELSHPDGTPALARVLAEQRAARDYLADPQAPDRDGARMALTDWVAEEVLLGEDQ